MHKNLHDRFDDDYEYFHKKIHSEDDNKSEAQLIIDLLDVKIGDRVLDAPCGTGRISEKLSKAGTLVTGIDLNKDYIRIARRSADKNGLNIKYAVEDLISLKYISEFNFVVCWYVSFGYFGENNDRKILQNYYNSLIYGGKIIIELIFLPNFIQSLSPSGQISSSIQINEDIMFIETSYDPITSKKTVQRTIVKDKAEKKCSWEVRYFTCSEIKEWLITAGFSDVMFVNKNMSHLKLSDDRMYVVASKKKKKK